MAYKVSVSLSAKRDMQEYHDFIVEREKSKVHAQKWYAAIAAELRSLKHFPKSRPLIPEANLIGAPLREAFAFSHRIILLIDEESKTVHVLRVYHSSRRPLQPDDLAGE